MNYELLAMHCLNVSADISQVIQREHDTYVSICMLQLSVKTHVCRVNHVCHECQTVIVPMYYDIIILTCQFSLVRNSDCAGHNAM